MKPKRSKIVGEQTPQDVIDAITIIAEYLKSGGYGNPFDDET